MSILQLAIRILLFSYSLILLSILICWGDPHSLVPLHSIPTLLFGARLLTDEEYLTEDMRNYPSLHLGQLHRLDIQVRRRGLACRHHHWELSASH